MDHIQKLSLEREKKFLNIMTLEIFDHLDPKRELKINCEERNYINWLRKYDPVEYDLELKRKRYQERKRLRESNCPSIENSIKSQN